MNVRRRRRRLVFLVALAGALALVIVAAPVPGLFLVVADRLQPSDAIFVLDGRLPARELEAATLYHRGLAPRVVLAHGRDPQERARRLAGEPAWQQHAVAVLQRLRVPPEAIVPLVPVVESTAQELAVDFDYARRSGFRRVILVTSPAHTRRVRTIWRTRYEARIPALVHPTPYDPFDGARWWRSRRAIETTLHEIVGIAHFVIGSPVPAWDR
jgi:uncharacterized SAM-binding protein YcdF (DUF218 family)